MSEQENRIWIKKIQITDCGRYYDGPHTLDFEDPIEKNITVILGESGSGKSTIHDLIYWCLYGEHKPKRKTNVEENEADYGLINTDKLETLEVGGEVTGSVSLTIHNEKGELYYLTRSLTAKYQKEFKGRIYDRDNNSEVRKGTEFVIDQQMMARNESGQREPVDDKFVIRNRISSIFPKELSDFFLFDGEELEKFEYASTSTGYVRRGIEEISGLDVLDKLKKTTEDASERLSDYVSSKSASSSGLNSTYQKEKIKCENLESGILDDKKSLKLKETKQEQYIIRLQHVKEGKDLESDLKSAKQIKKNLDKDRTKIRRDLHQLMFKLIPNLLCKDTFQNCEKIFRKLEDDDKIPPAITRKAIDKILTSSPLKCVCGRPFEQDDKTWENLTKVKKTIINERSLNSIAEGADLIGRMLTSVMDEKSISDQLCGLTGSRYEKVGLIESQDGKILEIEDKIRKIEDDEGEDIGALKTNLGEEITDLKFKIKNDEYDLEKGKTKRDKLKLDRDNVSKKENLYKMQHDKIGILNSISKFVKQQRTIIVESLRQETEDSTNKYFKKSVAQSESFDKVVISPKFEITARDDRDLQSVVSKGQGHVLGLSYVAGVRDISNVKTSLIIDSPLHNISSKSRNLMAESLSTNLPGVQLILLVTDTEYTESKKTADPVQEILRPSGNLSKEYEILIKEIDDPNEPGKKIFTREFGVL